MTTKSAIDLTYYRRKLAGEAPPIVADEPKHGYYRRFNDAIVIKPGTTIGGCDILCNLIKVEDVDKASDLWVGCAKNAIHQDIYARWIETRTWPEQEAMIQESSSLNKNLHELAELAAKAAEKLKARDEKISEEMRKNGVTTLQSQLEADTAAGYVQQIRAMVDKAEETVKLQLAPIKEQEKEIKRIWVDPFETLEGLKKFFLGKITEYGVKVKRESNVPDFKFAAGKAGDGKTIALKKKDVLVIDGDDGMKKLIKRFGKDPKVLEAYANAIFKAAETAWKAEKAAPDGTKVETTYDAV